MILQALNSYYERMSAEPDTEMPPLGTSIESISFALIVDEEGKLQDVEDLRIVEGKKFRPRKMLVPAGEKKANGIKPNFLWDTTSYVLGLDDKGNQKRTDVCHASFLKLVKDHCDHPDPGLRAVIAFLNSQEPEKLLKRGDWAEICGSNLVFRLDGVPGFVHERPAARKAWEACVAKRSSDVSGQCLISGEMDQPLARLHPSIKGVRGAQTAGASIVSFNLSAFVSYGKKQSFNAPISQKSAFAYTTALNSLLSRKSRQKMIIGDTTLVFWAQHASPAEDFLADLIEPSTENNETTESLDDPQTAGKIYGLLQAIRDGRRAVDILPDLDESVQFYILGLAPNAARLSVRLWEANSLGALLERIGRHFQELRLVRQFDSDPEFPPLWRLLCQTAAQGKSENVSPVLAGAMTKAMLTGSPYPHSLLPVVLDRIRAENGVTYFRAALLKAFLMRNHQMEVPVSLDFEKKDLPYLLGRLFAVLEKAQEEAVPGAGATIKDRYLASASATPGLVFHVLLKNAANHVAKLRKDSERKGRAYHFDTLTQDILAEIAEFPRTLAAVEQGQFMIGYYHQRKDFFTKKTQEG